MFREKTVLVLGAGASHPYGYPTGQGLIRELLDNSETQDLADTRQQAGYDNDKLAKFKDALEKAAFWSIDAFLEHRADDFGGIGKFLLAQRLLKKENPALFYRDNGTNWQNDNWYPMLVNAIAPTPAALSQNQLTVVNFNYDRSIKAYLFTAIKQRFNWPDSQTADALESIPFIHVHGNLGPLPWQKGGNPDSSYGEGLTLDRIERATKDIKIIHEANSSTAEFVAAQKALQEAKYIFFLGFGYHKANMERLGMPVKPVGNTNSMGGTGFGLTSAERNQLIRRNPGFYFGAESHKITTFLRNAEEFLVASEGD